MGEVENEKAKQRLLKVFDELEEPSQRIIVGALRPDDPFKPRETLRRVTRLLSADDPSRIADP